ncbi:MAG: protein-L-isoaspartate(D-aspartate) O-methyltransferase [Candidatus Omnitrophota bacterium]
MGYTAARELMVEEQLRSRGITDKKVLDAFFKVERHRFVPVKEKEFAYADYPLPIGEGQTISQPYIVALMTESLDLRGNERVLEIGTGSGYQTAILAEIVKEVFTVERLEPLAQQAQKVLIEELAYGNIHIKKDDGTMGWKEESPFDRIIVTAASMDIPVPLVEQLDDNGKLILPLGDPYGQMLTVAEKKDGVLKYNQICGCVFVPLIGKYSGRPH